MSGEMRLDGKVVLVTGAGRGLGRAYAHLLAARGASVVVNNRIRPGLEGDRPVAELVAAEIEAEGGVAVASNDDIAAPGGGVVAVATGIDHFGRLDAVVNNAGIAAAQTFAEYPPEAFEALVGIHLGGTFAITQAAWPHLVESGAGRIVNTVSRAAYLGDPQSSAYAAAKGAIHGMTRALAVEGAAVGIKANAICPAAWTPLYDRAATDLTEEQRQELVRRLRTEHVAPVIVALAHTDCPCNGEVLTAIGGRISRYFVAETTGIEVDVDFTPEELMERLPDVWDAEGYSEIGLAIPGTRGGGTPVAVVPPAAERRSPRRSSRP
jgi:NAD(P)-dependent dehydrogenase (short-subunit alcohol dehydrogenase family)